MAKTIRLDLENRTIIAIGWKQGHLIKPYDSLNPRQTTRIRNYLRGKKPIQSDVAIHFGNAGEKLKKKPKLVEIVGFFAESAVCNTAQYFMEIGVPVLINPERVISTNANNSEKTNAEYLKKYLKNMLLRYAGAKCKEHKKGLLFYR